MWMAGIILGESTILLPKFAGWEGGKAQRAPALDSPLLNLALTIQAQQICRCGRGQSAARPRSRFAATQPCIDNSSPVNFSPRSKPPTSRFPSKILPGSIEDNFG